jgi:hypothetical protein
MPNELWWKVKRAADKGSVTVRDWIVSAIEAALKGGK